MRKATCVSTVLGCVCLAAVAQAGPAKLPAVVAADLKETADECTGVGGRPDTGQAVRSADLNGDGRADYVLDVGSIVCEGAASVYGDRAKRIVLYAGDGSGGAQRAFDDAVYGSVLEGTGAAAKLWMTVSGQRCGKPAAASFANEAFGERYVVWNAAARRFDFAPVSTVRTIH